MDDVELLREVKNWFEAKYLRGMEEHGQDGRLIDRDIEDELLDLVVYILVKRIKQDRNDAVARMEAK